MANILVVDDDPDIREAVDDLLARSGHRVTTAGDGAQARPLLRPGEFDLIITDVKMPGMNGFDLLREIRQTCRDIPVILMTGFPSKEGILDSLFEGAFGYVEKPFDPNYLVSLVGQALLHKTGPALR
jgi:DNA-binding NtrC family response regulator